MFDLLVLTGVLGSLCFFIPTRMDGDELFTFYWCALIVICSLFFKKQRNIGFKLLGLNVLMAWATMFLNFKIPVRWEFINLLLGALSIITISQTTRISTRKLGWVLLAYYAISNVFIFLQILKLDKIYLPLFEEVSGVSTIPWMTGCTAVIGLPLVYRLNPLFCVVLIPGLFYSLSMSCVLSAAVMFCWLAVKTSKIKFKYILLLVLILITVFIAKYAHHLNTDRLEVWRLSAAFMKNHVYGNGLGSWAHEAFIRTNGMDTYHWRWAHNEFYQHYFEQGVVGLSLMLSWLVVLIFRTRDLFISTSLLGIVLISNFHPVMHTGRLLGLIIVVIALAHVSIQNQLTEK
jgi:hypothetical protein